MAVYSSKIKYFDFPKECLSALGLIEKDPQRLGLFEYFMAWIKIGRFSPLTIQQAAQAELTRIQAKDIENPLLKKKCHLSESPSHQRSFEAAYSASNTHRISSLSCPS